MYKTPKKLFTFTMNDIFMLRDEMSFDFSKTLSYDQL